jgi:hypothetical protein
MRMIVIALLVLGGTDLTANRVLPAQSDRRVQGSPFEARYEWIDIRKAGKDAGSMHTGAGAIHRDSMGRLRVDRGGKSAMTARISDPVADVYWFLDVGRKRVTSSRRPSDLIQITEITIQGQTYFCPPPDWQDTDPGDESIGQRVIEGVICDGFRREETDRRIEYWASSELHQVVFEEIISDFSDCTCRVYDIRKQEPDPQMFVVPADYTDVSKDGK